MKKRASKPKPSARKPVAVPAASPSDEMRRMLTSNAKLKRLYMMAKHCLRARIHIQESLAVMRRVKTSNEMSAKQRDLALRILNKYSKHVQEQADSRVMRLPESWEGLIGGLPPDVIWIPDDEFMRLGQKVCIPQRLHIVKSDDDTEEGGDDE